MKHSRIKRLGLLTAGVAMMTLSYGAYAWGDDGHEAVALIAWNHMTPKAQAVATAMFASDPEPFLMHDQRSHTNDSFATQATWADYYKYKDDQGNQHGAAYTQTSNWHFVDIEIKGGSLAAECPSAALPNGTKALEGPAADCVVDKIRQFTDELRNPNTDPAERLRALKMVMHFVGDVHQPLHSSDDHDSGGNGKTAKYANWRPQALHSYWDTQIVHQIGKNPTEIAAAIEPTITEDEVTAWSADTPETWAMEAYAQAQAVSYGELPKPEGTGKKVIYNLSDSYIQDSQGVIQTQIAKAGVRLAALLNAVLQ